MGLRTQGWQEGACLPTHITSGSSGLEASRSQGDEPTSRVTDQLTGRHHPAGGARGVLSQGGGREEHCQEKALWPGALSPQAEGPCPLWLSRRSRDERQGLGRGGET